MSLRPRYSLLTLLLLTAFVAGGVRFWRGPHRVVFDLDPTLEEAKLLRDYAIPLEPNNRSYEYEFTRLWEGKQLRYIAGRPMLGNYAAPSNKPNEAGEVIWHHLDESWIKSHVVTQLALEQRRQIVLWIVPCLPLPGENNAPTDTNGNYWAAAPYFLTERKQIFSAHVGLLGGLGAPISLEEIPYSYVRDRLAEELAKLPD